MPATIAAPVLFFTGPVATIVSGVATAAVGTDCPAGNLVVVPIVGQSGGSIKTLVDSAGNVYSRAIQQLGAHDCELWYVNNCLHLPAAGTFTATTVAGGNYLPLGAVYVRNAGGLDQTAGLSVTAATTFTLTTGAINGSEIAFAVCNDDGFTTFTEDVTWTQLLGSPVTNNPAMDFAWKFVSSAASWNPSWTAAQHVDGLIATFQATGFDVAGHTWSEC